MAGSGTVTVTTYAQQTALTTPAAVRALVPTIPDSDDALLSSLIDRASARIVRYCARPFARELYSETLAGYQANTLMLNRTPLVSVTGVSYLGTAIDSTSWTVQDREAGFLFREQGWDWTIGVGWNLVDYRIPDGERPSFTATYWAGYLLPSDDLVTANLSVDATDQSFNLAAGTFPLLVAGDRITSSQFSTPANNGTWTVVSRTATKVIVSETGMVTEAVSVDLKTLTVHTLPDDLEAAAIDTIKVWYQSRMQNPQVAEKRIGDLSIRFTEPMTALDLPFSTVALLAPWRRWDVAA